MSNYDFCADWIQQNKPDKNMSVLDFGCGAGIIVKKLQERGINAFGADVFYDGANYRENILPDIKAGSIKEIKNNIIPFADNTFDFVTNNQVMEHVENLDQVLSELARVLKPGGKVLSIFPEKSSMREGHIGIAFLHWFPKKSLFRVYFCAFWRALGFGYFKNNKSYIQFSKEACEWLDKWTFYRKRADIDSIYQHHFVNLIHLEDYWLKYRLGKRAVYIDWVPAVIKRLVVTKLSNMVFTAEKM